MRIADVVSRYLDSVDIVCEILGDEPSISKALVLPERLGQLHQVRFEKFQGFDQAFLAVLQMSTADQLTGVFDSLKPMLKDALNNGTWVFILKSHNLLLPHMLPALSEAGLVLLTIEATSNRGAPLVVVSRPAPEMQDSAPWTRILAATVGQDKARRMQSDTTDEGILRNQLRIRNEYICQDFIASRRESELRQKLQDSKSREAKLTTELEHLTKELKETRDQAEKKDKDILGLEREIKTYAERETKTKKQLESNKAEIERLEQEIKLASDALDRDKTQIHRQESALHKLEEELESTKRGLEKTKAQHLREVHQLQKKLKEAEAYQRQRQKQLKLVESRLEAARAKIESLHSTNRYKLAQLLWEFKKHPFSVIKLSKDSLALGRSILAKALSDGQHKSAPKAQKPKVANTAQASPRALSAPKSSPVEIIYQGRPVLPKSARELWVAGIFDEMSMACVEPECKLISFTPNNWQKTLEEKPPHFLFVESAWQGNDGSWQYKIGRYNHPDAEGLQDLLDWCQERQIPTVFWNKEDPVHFQKFKDAARRFDHVFTTDQNVVERYKQLENSRIKTVGVLPFAAQPRLHNPVFAGERSDAPCFAGSYYGNRHESRRKQQEALLDAARPFGLVLYDRNFGSNNPDFEFPERFIPHIKGRLPYSQLSQVYRQHKIFLNVNSVIDSPTMLSRRVFELLACGTVVVSTPSKALETIFGDLVPTVESEEHAREVISHLLSDDDARMDLVRRGIRFVFSEHTYSQRMGQVAKTLGLDMRRDAQAELSLIGLADKEKDARKIAEFAARQDHEISELVIGTTADEESIRGILLKELPGCIVRTVKQSSDDVSTRLKQLAQIASSDWVFVPGMDKHEDPYTLTDLALCTQFAQADIIGEVDAKSPEGPSFEHRFTDAVSGQNCLVRRSVLANYGWQMDNDKSKDFMAHLRSLGMSIYCARDHDIHTKN